MKQFFYKNIFVVLFALLFGMIAIPQIAHASDGNQTIKVVVSDYTNAPFPHQSRINGRPESEIGPEHFQSAKVALFYPESLTPDESEKVCIITYVHGWQTDISQSEFLELIQKAFVNATNLEHCIIVAPQFAFMANDNSAGKLGEEGGLEKLLLEVFEKNQLPGKIGNVIVIAYSGGYNSATKCLEYNPNLNFVGEVFLDGLLWYMEDASDRYSSSNRFLWLIYGQEDLSQNAMKAMKAIMNHAENKYVTQNEDQFEKRQPGKEVQIITTERVHEEIPNMLEMILKKLKVK